MATTFRVERKSSNPPIQFTIHRDDVTALQVYNEIIKEAGAVTEKLYIDPADISTIAVVAPTDGN